MQAQDSIAQSRPEAAQARGRALLNLHVQGAEGGLLGRTLLILVSNKVSVLSYSCTQDQQDCKPACIQKDVDVLHWLGQQ